MKVTSDIIKEDHEGIKLITVGLNPEMLESVDSIITYKHELEYLVDTESWEEICEGFKEDNSDFIDTPVHVEIYFMEKIEEILQDNYTDGFVIMIEWVEENLPEWILELVQDMIDEEKGEYLAGMGIDDWDEVTG